MDNKMKDYIEKVLIISLGVIPIVMSLKLLLYENRGMDKTFIMFSLITIIMLLEIFLIIRMRTRYVNNSEMNKLNKLLEYNKKRRELEEEINLLTRQLMNSDISEYLDINRIVFSGQNSIQNSNIINYDTFFKQFGLLNERIEIKKNVAIFLTPFTNEGEKLFNKCQRILSGIDVFLQRTDNIVEKDDIMMNIISQIVQSEIVIVNINGRNPNVYYELGIAHAIGKPTILLSETSFDYEDIGFDIRQKRIIMYDSEYDLEKQLLYQVSRIKSSLQD